MATSIAKKLDQFDISDFENGLKRVAQPKIYHLTRAEERERGLLNIFYQMIEKSTKLIFSPKLLLSKEKAPEIPEREKELLNVSKWTIEGLSIPLLSSALLISKETDLETLESPFAWKRDSYLFAEEIKCPAILSRSTISFTATRNSKILGYIPFAGTIIGISRIFKGIYEYKLFTEAHQHALCNRSINWIVRGFLEATPFLGGIICIITDIVANILIKETIITIKNQKNCGFCEC